MAAAKHKAKVTHGKARHVRSAVVAHHPKKHVAKVHHVAHVGHVKLKSKSHPKAHRTVGAKTTL